jgi:hypothetical protein
LETVRPDNGGVRNNFCDFCEPTKQRRTMDQEQRASKVDKLHEYSPLDKQFVKNYIIPLRIANNLLNSNEIHDIATMFDDEEKKFILDCISFNSN